MNQPFGTKQVHLGGVDSRCQERAEVGGATNDNKRHYQDYPDDMIFLG